MTFGRLRFCTVDVAIQSRSQSLRSPCPAEGKPPPLQPPLQGQGGSQGNEIVSIAMVFNNRVQSLPNCEMVNNQSDRIPYDNIYHLGNFQNISTEANRSHSDRRRFYYHPHHIYYEIFVQFSKIKLSTYDASDEDV